MAFAGWCSASLLRGAGPGERRGGREKGSKNKATVEREMEVARAVAALNRPLVWMVVRTRAKMAQRKKLAWYLLGLQPLLAIECLVTNEGWVADPVKAGAAGPPLQGLPPSHTRPPRSTAGHRDAASSAIFARIHAAANSICQRSTRDRERHASQPTAIPLAA